MSDKKFYQMTAEEVFADLGTNVKGLSTEEAGKKLAESGPNELTADISIPKWLIFLSQFRDLLVIVLVVAAAISFVIGSYRDGVVMVVIVMINAIIGFVQEYKVSRILDSLKNLFESGLVTNVAAKMVKLENGDYELTYRASAGKEMDGTPEMEDQIEMGLMMMESILKDFTMTNQVEVPTSIVKTNGTKSNETTAFWSLNFKNMAKSESRLQTLTFKGEGLDWPFFEVTAESVKKARAKAQAEADAKEKEEAAAKEKAAEPAVTPTR